MKTNVPRLQPRVLAAALVWFVAACGGGTKQEVGDAAAAASFLDVQIVLNGSGCTESGCHGGDAKGGLNLVDDPWAALVNVRANGCNDGRKLVVPGKPSASYLIDKVKGTKLCGGERMPRGCDGTSARPCLSEERVRTMESWIRAGARRDEE